MYIYIYIYIYICILRIVHRRARTGRNHGHNRRHAQKTSPLADQPQRLSMHRMQQLLRTTLLRTIRTHTHTHTTYYPHTIRTTYCVLHTTYDVPHTMYCTLRAATLPVRGVQDESLEGHARARAARRDGVAANSPRGFLCSDYVYSAQSFVVRPLSRSTRGDVALRERLPRSDSDSSCAHCLSGEPARTGDRAPEAPRSTGRSLYVNCVSLVVITYVYIYIYICMYIYIYIYIYTSI